MSDQIIFYYPEPRKKKTSIWPVFVPFSGCPGKCIYCAQDLQTGVQPETLAERYQQLRAELERALEKRSAPLELGFFGGTFTAMPDKWAKRFLLLAKEFKERGLISRIRCSTRPDFTEESRLKEYKSLGLDMVELGVQSFCEHVLSISQRGYTPEQAIAACKRVKACGLALGLQLLPGLPGYHKKTWIDDIKVVLKLEPACIRIYPCLVIKGTELAAWWEDGSYRPWDLEQCIRILAQGVLSLWRRGITVIRIGLPPEQALVSQILDGPWHPALGMLIRSRIMLYLLISHALILGNGEKKLTSPQVHQGEIWGLANNNLNRLQTFGLNRRTVNFHSRDYFIMQRKKQG